MIPVVFVTYSLAYLDRANFGFAAAGGMAEDLGISAATLSLLSALFFLGYFIFQIPGAHYASGKSAKKLIFWSLILWGTLATATGFVSNVTLLICIRFTLGVMESAVIPAMLILLSRWFTKNERSKANSFLILGNPVTMLWMSVLSGYLIDWIGWRGMFIIEGVPAVLWAFIWWRQIEDRPEKATWLSGEDKKLLKEKLLQEQEDIRPVKNYLAAFRSREVILLSLQLALWSIGTYGFMMWLPSVLKTAPGISIVEAGWLSSLAYGAAIIGMIGLSYFSDRSLKRKPYITGALLTASLAFLGLFLAKPDSFWLSYSLLVIAGAALCAPFGPFFALIAEILPRNVLGVSIAFVNSVGALGSFIGAYMVGYLNGLTGSFSYAFLLMSVAMFLAATIMKFGIKFGPQQETGPEHYNAKHPAFNKQISSGPPQKIYNT